MDITISPGRLSGTVAAIPSKSQAHRLLICAAFSNNETTLVCPETSQDIEATVDCLNSLGATILRTQEGYSIDPVSQIPESAELNCRESGSTLRFLLPISGALGIDTRFRMAGQLPQRPLSPLWEEMERMGCSLSRPSPDIIRCTGKLRPGHYTIDGSVSSQFISGLLFALALMEDKSTLEITGRIESRPYIDMTRKALSLFDAPNFHTPGYLKVDGDWSNGAFWLAANALGSQLAVTGLDPASPQGDRAAAKLLQKLTNHCTISAADIPDLVPVLSIAAACNQGVEFTDIRRLRLKESDRIASTIAMVEALGGKAKADENTLTIYGTGLSGGTVDSVNDHRIAMSAAIASTVCTSPVTILGAECVTKSYPQFWAEFARLGGNYEQYLR